jgi:hypothetical protein
MRRWSFFILPLLAAVLLTAAAQGIAEEAGGLTGEDSPSVLPSDQNMSGSGQAEAGSVPLRKVVLYSTGVGYFEHRGTVTGEERVRLSFPRQQMKDILKSLVVRDLGGGRIETVVYEARTPAEELLSSLPVRPDTIRSLADLLRRARGERITVEAGESHTGRIIAVEERPAAGERGPEVMLSLYRDGRVRSLALREAEHISFTDERFAALLEKGLEELSAGRERNRRTVEVRLRGEGSREVRIGYLRSTPVWKSSYRLEIDADGGGRLQGWAAAENTGGSRWEEVELSFVSGNPVSFVMDLYTPVFTDRPVIPPPAAALAPSPSYEESYSAETPQEESAPAPRRLSRSKAPVGAGAGPAAESAERKAALGDDFAVRAAAGAAGSLFAYRIDQPISVPAGSASLLPVLSAKIEAAPLTVMPLKASGTRPFRSLQLENTTGMYLAAGPITVFEEGIYAGDARIGETAPGNTRLISYALDLEARVVKERESLPIEIAELRISGGTLVYTRSERRLTRYRLVNSSPGPKRFLLEHPASSGGWRLTAPQEGVERSPSAYRLQREVPGRSAPGSPATAVIEVVEELPRDQQYALHDADPERIRYFLRGASPSPEVREALEEVSGMQAEIRSRTRELETAEALINDIHREQVRIRSNMNSLSENSRLYRRYVEELTAGEDRLEQLEQRRSNLREELRSLREELDNYLQEIDL